MLERTGKFYPGVEGFLEYSNGSITTANYYYYDRNNYSYHYYHHGERITIFIIIDDDDYDDDNNTITIMIIMISQFAQRYRVSNRFICEGCGGCLPRRREETPLQKPDRYRNGQNTLSGD